MSLLQTIKDDLKEAMKAKDTEKLGVLRMLVTDIKNVEIQKQKDLTDEEVQEIVSRQIKQRNDSIEQFTEGGRQELADKEEKEKAYLVDYLPEQLSTDTIESIIDDAISQTGASAAADFGNVAKIVMPKVKGQADSKEVSEMIKSKLQ